MSKFENSEALRQFSNRYASPFCKCEFPGVQTLTNYRGYIPDLVKCHCGEMKETKINSQWRWQIQDNQNKVKNHEADDWGQGNCEEQIWRPGQGYTDSITNQATDVTYSDVNAFIGNMGKDITFHPVYSQGTSIMRGNKALATGQIHYWEVRILTALTGTDVMFGIGTDKVEMNAFQFHFVSGLGTNIHSWGLSYHGRIQHKGIQKKYGQPFSQGCLIGIYLDRSKGYLEFFLNRQSLGIAYRNIPLDPNVKIYPMVCSTVARSCIRLVNATSVDDSLQFRSFQALAKNRPSFISTLKEELPGLRSLISKFWFLYVTKSSTADVGLLLFNAKELQKKVYGTPTTQTEVSFDKEKRDYLNDSGTIITPKENSLRTKRKKRFCPTLYDISDITDDLCSTSEKVLLQHHGRELLTTSGTISKDYTVDCRKGSYHSHSKMSSNGEIF